MKEFMKHLPEAFYDFISRFFPGIIVLFMIWDHLLADYTDLIFSLSEGLAFFLLLAMTWMMGLILTSILALMEFCICWPCRNIFIQIYLCSSKEKNLSAQEGESLLPKNPRDVCLRLDTLKKSNHEHAMVLWKMQGEATAVGNLALGFLLLWILNFRGCNASGGLLVTGGILGLLWVVRTLLFWGRVAMLPPSP